MQRNEGKKVAKKVSFRDKSNFNFYLFYILNVYISLGDQVVCVQ